MRALPPAYPLLAYRGKKYFRFQVRATQSGVNRSFWKHAITVPVIAPSPAAACGFIRDEIAPKIEHPTEIECAGVRGGVTHRFIGYDSLISAKMWAGRKTHKQLEFAYVKKTNTENR